MKEDVFHGLKNKLTKIWLFPLLQLTCYYQRVWCMYYSVIQVNSNKLGTGRAISVWAEWYYEVSDLLGQWLLGSLLSSLRRIFFNYIHSKNSIKRTKIFGLMICNLKSIKKHLFFLQAFPYSCLYLTTLFISPLLVCVAWTEK